MSPADFKRTLNHPENGVMTLDQLLALYAWHSRHHVAHITNLREAQRLVVTAVTNIACDSSSDLTPPVSMSSPAVTDAPLSARCQQDQPMDQRGGSI